MKPRTCWEIKNCGRQPEGKNVEELGICPAAVSGSGDGTNKGTYSGRFCWSVAGTFCEGEIQGTYAEKLKICTSCEVFKQVQEEEDRYFVMT